MDKNCEKIRELLPLFPGGELEENEQIAVDGHLPVCMDCAREAQEYAEARRNLAALREERIAEVDLWSGISSKLFPVKNRPSRREWAVRYAAVIVMGLGIGFLATQGSQEAPEETPKTAGSQEIRVVESDATPLGEADFAGTGRRSRRWFDLDSLFSLPEAASPSSGFVLPVVEEVHEEGERSF